MAAMYARVFSDTCFLYRNTVTGILSNAIKYQGTRCLYTAGALGMDGYLNARENIQRQFINITDKFRQKMQDFSEKESNMIFTEDLKHMIHLAQPNNGDVDLILKMIKRFNKQNKQLRFGNYVFGPVIMRMFHFLNEPESALEIFKDPEMDGFFDQLTTYQILMDLLYKHEKYEQIIEVAEIIKKRQIQNVKYPKNVVVLTFAACYKMNSPDSMKYATDLWRDLQTIGHVPMRKAVAFAAALALNQNFPEVALELVSNLNQQTYVTIRNIKVSALADLGRSEDCLPILRGVLQTDQPTMQKHTFTRDVMLKIKQALEKADNPDTLKEFTQIEKQLTAGGHITDEVLDDILCTDIEKIQQNTPGRNQKYFTDGFPQQRTSHPSQQRRYVRSGLTDLQ